VESDRPDGVAELARRFSRPRSAGVHANGVSVGSSDVMNVVKSVRTAIWTGSDVPVRLASLGCTGCDALAQIAW